MGKFKEWQTARQVKKRLRAAHKSLEKDGPFFAQAIQEGIARGRNPNVEQYTWLKLVLRACLGFARQGHAMDLYDTVKNAQFGAYHLRYVMLFLKRMKLEGSVLNLEEAQAYTKGIDAMDDELYNGRPLKWAGSEIRTDLEQIFNQAKMDRRQRLEDVFHA